MLKLTSDRDIIVQIEVWDSVDNETSGVEEWEKTEKIRGGKPIELQSSLRKGAFVVIK